MRECDCNVLVEYAVMFASPYEDDLEDPELVGNLEVEYKNDYLCHNCRCALDEELVWAHFKESGRENEAFNKRVPPGMGSAIC